MQTSIIQLHNNTCKNTHLSNGSKVQPIKTTYRPHNPTYLDIKTCKTGIKPNEEAKKGESTEASTYNARTGKAYIPQKSKPHSDPSFIRPSKGISPYWPLN